MVCQELAVCAELTPAFLTENAWLYSALITFLQVNIEVVEVIAQEVYSYPFPHEAATWLARHHRRRLLADGSQGGLLAHTSSLSNQIQSNASRD